MLSPRWEGGGKDLLPRLAGCVDGVNIKVMKAGGLREALRMIAVATIPSPASLWRTDASCCQMARVPA